MILDQIDRGNFLRILCYFEIFWPLCCILMMRVTTIFTLYTLLEWKKVSWWIKKTLVSSSWKKCDSFVNPELYFKSAWGPWTTSTFWQRENNQEIAINISPYTLYSCNKTTMTWIQIFHQNWNDFFSNISHQIMLYLTPIVSRSKTKP